MKNGEARVDIVDSLIKLRGKYSVIGRSLVVHEDEDDLGLGIMMIAKQQDMRVQESHAV